MDFSKMRHRIMFMVPSKTLINDLGEQHQIWLPYHPTKGTYESGTAQYMTVTDDGTVGYLDADGEAVSPIDTDILKQYEVWAYVEPQSGKEYSDSQMMRAETTYNIITRHFAITQDMKILFRGRVLSIISILDIGERFDQLRIVASEVAGH